MRKLKRFVCDYVHLFRRTYTVLKENAPFIAAVASFIAAVVELLRWFR